GLRTREWRAALPALGDARITRRGQAAGTEVGADPQVVGIVPVDVGLRFRYGEAVGYERLGAQIELAVDGRIGAAARKPQHAALVRRIAVFRAEAHRRVPYPVFSFALRQRVEIEHRFPWRTRLRI